LLVVANHFKGGPKRQVFNERGRSNDAGQLQIGKAESPGHCGCLCCTPQSARAPCVACHGLGARCAVKPSRPLTASTRAGGRSRRFALSGGGRAALREARNGSPLCAGAAAAGAAAAGAAAGARTATSGTRSEPPCVCQASMCAKPVFTRAATHGCQADAGCLGAAARAAGRGRATRTRTGAEAGRPGRAAPMTPHCATATGALFCPDACLAFAALRLESYWARESCFIVPRLVLDCAVSLPWACSAQAAHVTHR